MRCRLLGFYNYTVVLTYMGMAIGFLGILLAAGDDYRSAIICLMISGFCDMFDGAIASTMKRNTDEKVFGVQIDSLSDLICFGVLPATIICNIGNYENPVFIIGTLYVLCALIRLAYFNVDEQKRQSLTEERRKIYYGLPVTAIALLLPLAIIVCSLCGLPKNTVSTALLAVTGCLFLIPFKLRKPRVPGKVAVVLLGSGEFALALIGMGDL